MSLGVRGAGAGARLLGEAQADLPEELVAECANLQFRVGPLK